MVIGGYKFTTTKEYNNTESKMKRGAKPSVAT